MLQLARGICSSNSRQLEEDFISSGSFLLLSGRSQILRLLNFGHTSLRENRMTCKINEVNFMNVAETQIALTKG